jgi:hypothetical protein
VICRRFNRSLDYRINHVKNPVHSRIDDGTFDAPLMQQIAVWPCRQCRAIPNRLLPLMIAFNFPYDCYLPTDVKQVHPSH